MELEGFFVLQHLKKLGFGAILTTGDNIMVPSVAQKIDNYFTSFPKRAYRKDQILLFPNEIPEHIFYITKGTVKKYDISYRGDEVIVNIFKPPAFFPMSWALNNTLNKFFYSTDDESEVHVIPVKKAVEFIKNDPDILLDLLQRVYTGTEGLLGRVVQLMSGTAKSRVVYELIVECRRFGKKDDEGAYHLTTNEVGFASRTGLTRETVSREMHKLKNKGLVSVSHDGIMIKDLQELEEILESR